MQRTKDGIMRLLCKVTVQDRKVSQYLHSAWHAVVVWDCSKLACFGMNDSLFYQPRAWCVSYTESYGHPAVIHYTL